MAEQVSTELVLEVKDALNNLTKLQTKANDTFDAIAADTKKAASGFNVFKGALGAGVALSALNTLKNVGVAAFRALTTEAVAAAQVQEDAVNRLSGALRSTGEFSQAAVDDFKAYAAGLQEVTRFGDEVVLNQLALAKSFGASNEQAKQIVTAATDLSAAFGIDLESATRNVAKTLGGFAGELGETIPQLKNLTTEQLQAGEGVTLLAERFRGQAANSVQTFSGQLDQLFNAFGDLQEAFGNAIINNQSFIDAIKRSTEVITEITGAVGAYFDTLNPQDQGDFASAIAETEVELARVEARIKSLSAEGGAGFRGQGVELRAARADAMALREELAKLEQQKEEARLKEIQAIEEERARRESSQGTSGGGAAERSQKEIEAERKKQEELQRIKDEFALIEKEKQIVADEERLLKEDEEFAMLSEKLGREQAIKLTAREQIATTSIEIEKARLAKAKALNDAEIKQESEKKKKLLALEKGFGQAKLQATADVFNALGQISALGGQKQFKITKALNIAQATTSGILSIQRAAASAPPPFNIPAIVSASAFSAANLAKIIATKPPSFQTGGIVPGTPTPFDNQTIQAASGELLLNRPQQQQLFDIINNPEQRQASSPQEIVIEVSGREIARALIDQREEGFAV